MADHLNKKHLDQKKDQSGIAESPIAEVFEGRHPADSEKKWAETTLAKTLEKAPEKPIGAASGVNLDENGQAQFTTISGLPIRRLYTQADLPEDWSYEKYLNYPGPGALYAWHPCQRLSWTPLDHAPVFRLCLP